MPNDAVSMLDERQPFHRIDGKTVTQREWRENLRDATELLEMFKSAVYKAHEM